MTPARRALGRDRWGGWYWLACAIALLSVLGGCATPVPTTSPVSSAGLVRDGRFALKSESFGREPQAVQGGYAWRDTGPSLTLDLTNPLGSVLARVQVEPRVAVLTRANGEVTRAPGPDALLETVLGQPMPVQGLRQWLRTMREPLPGMQGVERDEQGRIAAFEQDGWRVQLSRFDDVGPRLLVMRRQEADRVISLRLVVDGP